MRSRKPRAITKEILEKFYTPEPNSGCWLWVGAVSAGYGTIWDGVRNEKAHRISYCLHKGPIPDGLYVCHKCDNRACINPDHLFLGSAADNNRDCMAKKRFRAPHTRGSRHGHSKLTETDVEFILNSPSPAKHLAQKFNVHVRVVFHIRAGKRWTHVPRPVNRAYIET